MEKEVGRLGRKPERMFTDMGTAHPPKCHCFSTVRRQHCQSIFPDTKAHRNLKLKNCEDKSQARYFWNQSVASGESKAIRPQKDPQVVRPQGHSTWLEVFADAMAELCPLCEVRQFRLGSWRCPVTNHLFLGTSGGSTNPMKTPSLIMEVHPGSCRGILLVL